MSHTNKNHSIKKHSFFDKIEHIGDKIPQPFFLFIFLCLIIVLISAIAASFGSHVEHPGTGEQVYVRSLLTGEGIVYILESMVSNFVMFKPLGLVLCMMIAIGLVQEVGLADSAIKYSLLNSPKNMITAFIFLTGIIGNLASDAAFILVPPLAGMVFAATNRNPIIGIAAGFVAVAAGFTANLFIAGTDVLLSGITTEATAIVSAKEITPAANWYFMLISVPFLVILGTIITDKFIEPRFSKKLSATEEALTDQGTYEVNDTQKKALKVTGITALIFVATMILVLWPESSPLRNETGGLVPSPFLKGIIPIIMTFFIICAVTYGFKANTIKSSSDIPLLMAKALQSLSGYIVLVFVIAQFIAWFNWSNLAIFIAVNLADLLSSAQLPSFIMLAAFMMLAGFMNLLIFSGSAQWAIMAPVFIPMFMLLNVAPEYTQMAYRIADSTTNIISPTNPYMPMVLALMTKYNKNIKFGAFISIMLPYVLVLFSAWGALFLIYMNLGLPVGPMSS